MSAQPRPRCARRMDSIRCIASDLESEKKGDIPSWWTVIRDTLPIGSASDRAGPDPAHWARPTTPPAPPVPRRSAQRSSRCRVRGSSPSASRSVPSVLVPTAGPGKGEPTEPSVPRSVVRRPPEEHPPSAATVPRASKERMVSRRFQVMIGSIDRMPGRGSMVPARPRAGGGRPRHSPIILRTPDPGEVCLAGRVSSSASHRAQR